ncbi:hypothetical protein [Vibrio scophthalmi]|uniref:Uncharacterized protein n=1 Tax=Vibrio scophthalmi TaxID=45658 RepID=A0A1C7FER7_9VIBR|nr:hypothetical protein [Vibrio scophthalmi]ANU38238.1 hypothetical protein VSVS05_03200 [Vibrio scophthalmi]
MKNQDCTTEEIAKSKEPNSVHEFAEPAMLQTKLQQAKNGDEQRPKNAFEPGKSNERNHQQMSTFVNLALSPL